MSTIITGDPSTITTLVCSIVDASNASPIVIETSVAHLFATFDRVLIFDVGGNTAANGIWTITKLTSTTFELDGSTGSGAYTSGGTALDLSLTPQFTIPDDGDVLDAASMNVALEALADRTQYLLSVSPPVTRSEGVDSDTTWTTSGGPLYIELNDFAITAPRIYTLSNTGADPRFPIHVYARGPAAITNYFTGSVTVKNAAGTTLKVISSDEWGIFRFTGSFWFLAEGSP